MSLRKEGVEISREGGDGGGRVWGFVKIFYLKFLPAETWAASLAAVAAQGECRRDPLLSIPQM